MIEPKLTPAQQALRDTLLDAADFQQAKETSNELMLIASRAFNDAHTNVATSLLARSLFCHAMLQIAGQWWADVTKHPMPDTFAAITDLTLNLDPAFEPRPYVDPSL